MREDPAGSKLTLLLREPRVVVAIIYETGSIYVTNKAAGSITNVPGNVVPGCLEDVSATSQELFPEEGRATIGSLSFSVTDVSGALTAELRAQLASNRGVGRKQVRVYTGDSNNFTDGTWRQVDTYVVDSVVEYDRGSYSFACSDLQRELRDKIFIKRTSRLVADITAADTSITVSTTANFPLVEHTAAFSDAPSATVGYARIKKSGEVFRYTGTATSPTRFTGVTRGVFNTLAQAVDVDPAADEDRQPEIEYVYYLEMPAPQMAYALMTGNVPDTAIVLPADFHLGIDTALVDLEMFRQVGTDLYNPSDLTAGLVLSFSTTRGLKETDGKRFIEEQLCVPMWTFMPISCEGKIGLRKLTRMLSDAAPQVVVSPTDVISHGVLEHRTGDVVNRIAVSWNHDGEDFTRLTELLNATSITRHGLGLTRDYELLGLTVQRHTTQTLNRIFNAIADRYGAPPQYMELTLSSALNRVEIGDVLRVVLPGVRDFANTSTFDRSLEVQKRSMNWRTGELTVSGFASTATVEAQPAGNVVPLSDAWYTSTGTALSSVLTMTGNNVTANGNLTAGTYYHAADFQVNVGVTVTVNGTVQLRIRGTPTINGTIDGIGRGNTAIANPSTVGNPITYLTFGPSLPTFPQTFGSTSGSSGLVYVTGIEYVLHTQYVRAGIGAAPRPALETLGGALLGIPTDCAGTPGIYGGDVLESPTTVRSKGAAGGNSGAGLVIVSRGTPVFGASGSINLSGAAGSAPGATVSLGGHSLYAGAGGGGAPGLLYVFLDGNALVLPDLTTKFVASVGATPQTGNPIERAGPISVPNPSPADPWTGWYPGIGSLSLWRSAQFVTWVPDDITLGTSDDEVTPAPTSLAAAADTNGVAWSWEPGPVELSDYTELWVAITNDRTGALLASRRKSSSAFVGSSVGVTRYGWVRNFKNGVGYSAWHPLSSTSGVVASYGGATGIGWFPALSAGMSRSDSTFTKTGGAGAWDSAFYSQDGYEACEISFRASTASSIMVGLNTDPTTNHSYETIDFALYLTGSFDLRIYESGVDIGSFGSWATTDQLRVLYDGAHVYYFKNSTLLRKVARPLVVGTRYFADSSFFTPGGSVNSVTFNSIGRESPPTGNLLRSEAWAVGDVPTAGFGNFLPNETATDENNVYLGVGPGGLSQMIWEGQCTDPGVGSGGDANGGWANAGDIQGLNPAKAYRLTVWARRRVSSGGGNQFYFGCSTSETYDVGGGGSNGNPYFIPGPAVGVALPVLDRWYLCVGIIHGSGYTGSHSGIGGIYDPETGQRIYEANDFRMAPTATAQLHRVYQYYGGNTSVRIDWCDPRFEEINGNEPTISALLTSGQALDWRRDFIHDEMAYLSAADLHAHWVKHQGGIADADITLITDTTAPGGQAVRFGNNSGNDEWWGAFKGYLLPYDGIGLYEVGAVVKRASGSGLFYCGLEGVANDKQTLINTVGANDYSSQHYAAAAGAAPSSSWQTYRGFVRGRGTTGTGLANDPRAPTVMYDGTVYVRPLLICNYTGAAGQMDVAAVWVRRIPGEQAAVDTDVYKQSSAPTHALGRIWIDTSTSDWIVKRSTGSTWEQIGSLTLAGMSGSLPLAKQDLASRGWTFTGTFSATDADTVAWTSGTFTAADGTAYSISSGDTANMAAITYVYLDVGVSTTVLQKTTTATAAIGSGRVLIAVAQNGTDEATFQVFGGTGGVQIRGDSVVANSITANEIAATITWTKDLTIDTAGKIRQGKSSASSTTAGFWLGHDGSSSYDFHIGDATNYFWWDGSAATLKFRGNLDFGTVTFTPNWNTGFSSAPSGDFSYIDFGSFVMLWVPADRLGTGNANSFSIDNLPSAIRPSNARLLICPVQFGGVDNVGHVTVQTDGGVTWQCADITAAAGSWPSTATARIRSTGIGTTGTNGLRAGWVVMYPK